MIEEAVNFINGQDHTSQIHIGCDSERIKKKGVWYADYIIAIAIHIGGNKGCKIFGMVIRERDFDQKLDKPRMRLMNEAIKAAEVYLEVAPQVAHDITVHLDLNPDLAYGSSCVVQEAIGYIKGTCNVTPLVKPEAWAASCLADRFKGLECTVG